MRCRGNVRRATSARRVAAPRRVQQQGAAPLAVAPRPELRDWLRQWARAPADAGIADSASHADGAVADA
eukprot:6854044-Lingulodinium_polyedra.AAC.1